MRESDLDLDTKIAMKEYFKDQVCSVCKAPAQRHIRSVFFCHQCATPEIGTKRKRPSLREEMSTLFLDLYANEET